MFTTQPNLPLKEARLSFEKDYIKLYSSVVAVTGAEVHGNGLTGQYVHSEGRFNVLRG